jgi:hypothetical protein
MFDDHVPPPRNDHPAFKQMSVGQSVFVPHEGGIMSCRAYNYAATIQKRSRRYKFSGRSVTENGVRGVRIWRTR